MPNRAIELLMASNINTIAVMARIANDENTVLSKWAKKYIDGTTIGLETYKSTDDDDVTNAYFVAAWEDCVASRKATQAAASATITTAGHGVPSASVGAPAASSILSQPSKVPKELGQGRWSGQIAKYESIQLAGANRVFPAELIMGAEATLARMLYEHETSSHYTPVKLGEIIGNRCMNKDGKLNTFAEKTKDKVLGIHVSSGGFALQEEDVYNPRSMWQIADGIEAAQWALIFAEWGSEIRVTKWCDHFQALIRKHNRIPEAIKTAWDTMGLKLCIRMRNKETFDSATTELLKETAEWQEFFMTPPSPIKKRPTNWGGNETQNRNKMPRTGSFNQSSGHGAQQQYSGRAH